METAVKLSRPEEQVKEESRRTKEGHARKQKAAKGARKKKKTDDKDGQ